MTIDRGILARIDRRVFAELGDVTVTQAVKVPLSEASWSTWRRYCQAIGLTMGEVVAGRREKELGARELQIAVRERAASEIEKRSRQWMNRLGAWDRDLQAQERRLALAAGKPPLTNTIGRKVGRNEPCPCGSGLKRKRCHGLTGHRT